MEWIITYLKKPTVRRFMLLAVMAFILYLCRSMITLFLLTFIFIFLINAAQKLIYSKVSKYIPIKRTIIIVSIYVIIITLIGLFLWYYIPKIAAQTVDVFKLISGAVHEIMTKDTLGNSMLDSIRDKLRTVDWNSVMQKASNTLFSYIGSVGTLSVDFLLSIILSMFFLLQKGRCKRFMRGFKNSKISWLYDEMAYFSSKFANTFGKVIETQILISFINCLLSIAMLAILGFPSVLGLGVMIFVLGLIPVAGVFISLFPLCIVAFSVGGLTYIIYVLIIIAVLHTVESYILNPKLMSSKTNLPVFFTFLIITVSGHFFGIWGLLVGIPVFVFILDVLGVDMSNKSKLPSAKDLKSKIKTGIEKNKSVKKEHANVD